MWDRHFICSVHNADVDGLIIKQPRVSLGGEWFRFAYWYVRETAAVQKIEALFRSAAAALPTESNWANANPARDAGPRRSS
jgi:hypothetical protein